MFEKLSSFIYFVTTPNLLMHWLTLESNLRTLPTFSKSNFSSYSWCSTNTWFYYVISKFDPILITRLRNNYLISLVIRLKGNYVDSQFDNIIITPLRAHYITYISLNKFRFLKDGHISAVLNVFFNIDVRDNIIFSNKNVFLIFVWDSKLLVFRSFSFLIFYRLYTNTRSVYLCIHILWDSAIPITVTEHCR